MGYPLYIEASEETLRMLDEKFKPVAEDRFLYSLQQKRRTIEDIHKFNASLQISYDYTLKEYERIKELGRHTIVSTPQTIRNISQQLSS